MESGYRLKKEPISHCSFARQMWNPEARELGQLLKAGKNKEEEAERLQETVKI